MYRYCQIALPVWKCAVQLFERPTSRLILPFSSPALSCSMPKAAASPKWLLLHPMAIQVAASGSWHILGGRRDSSPSSKYGK